MASGLLSSVTAGLAQSSGSDDTVSLLILGGVLIAVALALGMLILYAKKRYNQARSSEPHGSGGFDITDVEAMRESGGITDEEFAVLRKRSLGLDETDAKKDKSTSSAPTGQDDNC